MQLSALLLTSGLFWLDIQAKQALVCEQKHLSQCIQLLEPNTQKQLPSMMQIMAVMAGRSGMALPLDDPKIAGMLVINTYVTPRFQQGVIEGNIYQIALKQQDELSLWHEIGHLQIEQLQYELIQQKLITSPLSQYQHETFADLYLVWKSVQQTQHLSLAWQQYHRRNLAFITDIENISHWSVPVLYQVFELYSAEQIMMFKDFNLFLKDYLSKIKLLQGNALIESSLKAKTTELDEYKSLVQHLFSTSTVTYLQGYIYWRRPQLKRYLAPTLIEIMGQDKALTWLNKYLTKQSSSHLN